MEDLKSRYLSVCAEVQRPPKACVLKVLADSANRSVDVHVSITTRLAFMSVYCGFILFSDVVSLVLAGNDRHGDRLTDDDVLVLSKTLVGNSAIKGKY